VRKNTVRDAALPAMKAVPLRLTEKQWVRLKRFALDERTSVQVLAMRGLSRLMVERGLAPLVHEDE
jgi:hypothetical protein